MPVFGEYPRTVIVMTTLACNQRCWYCAQDEYRRRTRQTECNRPELILQMIDALPRNASLHFTGGEPLLEPATFDAIGAATRRGMATSLTTNGMLLEAHATQLAESGLRKVIISIDTIDEEEYARLRGVPKGSLKGVLRGVRAVRRQSSTVVLKANIVVTSISVDGLSDTPGLLREAGFEQVSVSHLQWKPHSRGLLDMTSNGTEATLREAQSIDLDVLEDQLESLPTWVEEHPRLRGAKLQKYYRGPDAGLEGGCHWPSFGCYVSMDGRVSSCSRFVMGDLSRQGIHEIWTSSTYDAFRHRAAEAPFPECRTCCHQLLAHSQEDPFDGVKP